MPKSEKLKLYAQWAETYEQDSIAGDYYAWPICAEKILKVIVELSMANPLKPVRLLDAGCGTGYLGMLLKEKLKQRKIPIFMLGLDYSKEMIEQTRKKQCYDEVAVGDITMPLAEEAHNMDIVVCMGVFLDGHCGASALPNVLDCVRKNGTALITIRSTTVEKKQEEYLQAVADANCEIIERQEERYCGPVMAEYWTIKKIE